MPSSAATTSTPASRVASRCSRAAAGSKLLRHDQARHALEPGALVEPQRRIIRADLEVVCVHPARAELGLDRADRERAGATAAHRVVDEQLGQPRFAAGELEIEAVAEERVTD